MTNRWLGMALACGVNAFAANASHALTLDEYVAQVERDSLDQRQYAESSEAARLAVHEAELIFAPSLFFNAEANKERALANPPLFFYREMRPEQYTLGLSKQFSFGLQSKLSYKLSRTNTINSSLPTNMDFWDAKPVVELTLPLWGNGFGRTARAQRELTLAQAEQSRAGAYASGTQLRVQAETIYWKVSAAREAVAVQERALKSAQDVREYVAKKSRMNLGERSDVVQASALVEARQLQVLQARNDLRVAAQEMNALKQVNSAEVPATMDPIDRAKIESLTPPTTRPGDRVDLATSEASARVAQANATVAAEKNRPTLEVYGSYALNGRHPSGLDATKDVTIAQRDTVAVGLRLNVPLQISALDDARRAALMRARAARTTFEQASFTQDKDWTDLSRKIQEMQANLKLAGSVEAIQTEKLALEKERLRQGRTSTYQVLLFEQDLLDSQLARLRSAASVLSLRAQLLSFANAAAQKGAP